MKFICLQRDLLDDTFSLHELDSPDQHQAWDGVQEHLASSNSQEWLMDMKSFEALKKVINREVAVK